jgi:hypothetical protein
MHVCPFCRDEVRLREDEAPWASAREGAIGLLIVVAALVFVMAACFMLIRPPGEVSTLSFIRNLFAMSCVFFVPTLGVLGVAHLGVHLTRVRRRALENESRGAPYRDPFCTKHSA